VETERTLQGTRKMTTDLEKYSTNNRGRWNSAEKMGQQQQLRTGMDDASM